MMFKLVEEEALKRNLIKQYGITASLHSFKIRLSECGSNDVAIIASPFNVTPHVTVLQVFVKADSLTEQEVRNSWFELVDKTKRLWRVSSLTAPTEVTHLVFTTHLTAQEYVKEVNTKSKLTAVSKVACG